MTRPFSTCWFLVFAGLLLLQWGGSESQAALRPEFGGRVTWAVLGDFDTDPAQLSFPASSPLNGLVYETLLQAGPTGQLQPGLAESWEWEAEGKRLRLVLRPSVFSDGTPVQPAVVLASLTRLKAGPQAWLSENLLLTQTSADPARDLAEIWGEAVSEPSSWEGLSESELDSETIQAEVLLELEEPDPHLPYKLAHPAMAIVREDSAGRLLGTGPFRILRVEQDELELEGNPYFRDGPPFLESLVLQRFTSLDAAFRQLERGQLDLGPVPYDQVDRLQESSRGLRVESLSRLESVVLVLNRERFDSQAKTRLLRLLDLDSILRFRLRGHAQRAETFEPRLAPYQQSGLESPTEAVENSAWSPDSLELLFPQKLGLAEQLAERLRQDLFVRNLPVRLNSLPEKKLFQRLQAKDFDLALVFVRSTGSPPLTLLQWSHFLGFSTADLTESVEGWLQQDEALRRSGWVLPLFWTTVYQGSHSRLVQLRWSSGGRPFLEQAWWKILLDNEVPDSEFGLGED